WVDRKSLALRCAATSHSGLGFAARSTRMAVYRCTRALSGWWDSSKRPGLLVSSTLADGQVNRAASTCSHWTGSGRKGGLAQNRGCQSVPDIFGRAFGPGVGRGVDFEVGDSL